MSSMLDQAIIDATSLQEAALKNAESLILEKYSKELKETLESMLEQDEMMPSMGDPTDPLAGEVPSPNSLTDQIPLASTDGETACACPEEDEEIEINFDQLQQQVDQQDAGMAPELPGQMDLEEPQGMMEESLDGVQVPVNLAPDLHFYHENKDDAIFQVGQLAYEGKLVPKDLLESAIANLMIFQENISEDQEETMNVQNLVKELKNLLVPSGEQISEMCDSDNKEEEYELSESDVNDLLETMNVKLDVVPHGHAGHATQTERTYAEDMAKAAEQDDETKEYLKNELSSLKESVKKLQKQNQSLDNKLKNSLEESKRLSKLAIGSSKMLEKINIENAKLFYENKALKSASLNERQRKSVVDAVSKAESVDEARIVSESLTKSFNESKKESSIPDSLSDALEKTRASSSIVKSILSENSKHSENVENFAKERLQKLAGIKKTQI